MKKHVVKALKWALSKFEPTKEEITPWPFPTPEAANKVRKIVVKATTRKAKVPAKTSAKKKK